MPMETPVILHAERSFLVCCKPVGVECEHELPALLAEALHCKAEELYCVHRLDRVVGGVMVYARTRSAAAELSRQVQERTLQKEYLAVCEGVPAPREGTLRDYLYKDTVRQKSFPVASPRRGVKEAVLDYAVLQEAALSGVSAALVHVKLQTGRFHQIRCQFAARTHPLLGDGKYGSRERGCTTALWSCRLAFLHPLTRAPLAFEAAPPQCFPWSGFSITMQ